MVVKRDVFAITSSFYYPSVKGMLATTRLKRQTVSLAFTRIPNRPDRKELSVDYGETGRRREGEEAERERERLLSSRSWHRLAAVEHDTAGFLFLGRLMLGTK